MTAFRSVQLRLLRRVRIGLIKTIFTVKSFLIQPTSRPYGFKLRLITGTKMVTKRVHRGPYRRSRSVLLNNRHVQESEMRSRRGSL